MLANLWVSLELFLSCRFNAAVSVPKVSFMLRFADEFLAVESRPDEVRRVFIKCLAARGWR